MPERAPRSPLTLYVDAASILGERKSGIGHVTLSTLQAIDRLLSEDQYSHISVKLIVSWHKRSRVTAYNFKNIGIQTTLLTGKMLNLLARLPLPLPLAVWRRGVYIFPNFRNFAIPFSPSITYIHDVCFALFPDMVEAKNRAMLTRYAPLWIKRTSQVVTVSESSRQEIIESFDVAPEKVAVILNACDPAAISKADESIERVREKYGLQPSYLMFLSNVEPRKNLPLLLNAYESLGVEFSKEHNLCIVGAEGWLSDDVLDKMHQLKEAGFQVVHPTAYVPDEDIEPLLTGASMLVQPSFHEGFGVSPLRAMAYGTPVIVSDIPAHRELVGDAGLYVGVDDSAGLAAHIKTVLGDESVRNQLIQRGHERSDAFTWRHSAETLLALCMRIR